MRIVASKTIAVLNEIVLRIISIKNVLVGFSRQQIHEMTFPTIYYSLMEVPYPSKFNNWMINIETNLHFNCINY